jgi:hypothetical protein
MKKESVQRWKHLNRWLLRLVKFLAPNSKPLWQTLSAVFFIFHLSLCKQIVLRLSSYLKLIISNCFSDFNRNFKMFLKLIQRPYIGNYPYKRFQKAAYGHMHVRFGIFWPALTR